MHNEECIMKNEAVLWGCRSAAALHAWHWAYVQCHAGLSLSVASFPCESGIPFGPLTSAVSVDVQAVGNVSRFRYCQWPNGMTVRWSVVCAFSRSGADDKAFVIPFCRKSVDVNRQCRENRKVMAVLREGKNAKRNPQLAREGAKEE